MQTRTSVHCTVISTRRLFRRPCAVALLALISSALAALTYNIHHFIDANFRLAKCALCKRAPTRLNGNAESNRLAHLVEMR